MYFQNREQAGQLLAAKLYDQYRYENCAVVALSDGGVLVGEQIAAALHCVLTLLLIEDIQVPGEGVGFGGVSQDGNFTYNSTFSSGEIEEYMAEFHGYLEEQKREAFQKINRLIGDGGVIANELLRNRTVILVDDGLYNSVDIDVAINFLKPICIQKLVIATPIASVSAIDKLHVSADELHILDVRENFIEVDHYYTENNIPSHEETIAKINQIILNWR
ncbi:MAG: phosphoribosyltransferase family protein [Candidatus Paceibacterota bacterium]|jgi:putative phosphoribosyl transferase